MSDLYIDQILIVAKQFRVFPVSAKSRKPIKGWQAWATQDEEKIKTFWTEHRSALMGIACGEPSGIFAVDLDRKKGKNGVKTMRNYEQEYSDLPKTYTHTTPNNGVHRLFKLTDACKFKNGVDVMKNGIKDLKTGIDIRTTGGYILAWPTVGYKKIGNSSEVVDAPDWLIEQLNKPYLEARTTSNTGRTMDESELEEKLSVIDPVEYQDRESWMRVMMMCKNACDGDEWGKGLFTDWSLRDRSGFSVDPAQYIEEMWPSLDTEREDGITCNSLDYEVRKARVKKDAESFGDEGQDIVAPPVPDAPKKKKRYTATVVSEVGEGSTMWHYDMDKAGNRRLSRSENNLIQFLLQPHLPPSLASERNPLSELFKYNQLKQAVVYSKVPPWARVVSTRKDYIDRVVDRPDITELRRHVHIRYGLNFAKDSAAQAVEAAAHRLPFHPAKEYCESLDWDWDERLETWLIKCAGAENNPYIRAVSKKLFISMVARIYRPGCKVDTIPILEGPQGHGKSTMLQIIGGDWYASPEIKIGDKDAEQNLQGTVLAEWAEWAKSPREMSAFRAFVTKGTNRFRASYGQVAKDWPRTGIIVITINPEGDGRYMTDRTGNRRLWPIPLVGHINLNWVRENRDQLFAEATYYYKAGEPWHLTTSEEVLASAETASRLESEPWMDAISDYLYGKGDGTKEDCVTCTYIAEQALGISLGRITKRETNQVAKILRDLGWVHGSRRIDRLPRSVFSRPMDELNA